MKILKKEVDKPWKVVEIENTLEALQQAVGGYIETVTFKNAAVICDEEGILKGKKYNATVCEVPFVGDILIVGIKGDDFCDLIQAEAIQKRLTRQEMSEQILIDANTIELHRVTHDMGGYTDLSDVEDYLNTIPVIDPETLPIVRELRKENTELREKLKRYEQTYKEIF